MRNVLTITVFAVAAIIVTHEATLGSGNGKATQHVVTLKGMQFDPADLKVKVGDSVKFVNAGGTHTATSIDITTADPKLTFNTGLLLKGQEAVVNFNEAGKFDYRCEIHKNMKGSITVEAAK